MRFKIHGEKEKLDDKITTVVEILGKKAIENMMEEKIRKTCNDLERQILELRERVDKLEEETRIKRKELLKLEVKDG